MSPAWHKIYSLLISNLSLRASATDACNCKSTPNTPQWPSETAWSTLNDSIDGHLLRPLPPAAVCDSDLLAFDNAACAKVRKAWSSSSFHANDPVSLQYPNWECDACLPMDKAPCRLDAFPVYVVNASEPQHVQAGVNFARENNIRLVVKGTGHDYLGRSTAPSSMSIWTHHLNGIEYQETFTPLGCKERSYEKTLTIAAGHQMRDIYTAVSKHDRFVVGGADPNVGIGGYITGGGHSAISSKYGLAVDHVIEFQVVTPDGSIRAANECKNSDLYWALKGGGGSTFGILLSVTVTTVPESSMGISVLAVNSTNPSSLDDFFTAAAYLTTQIPLLNDNGLMGYTFLVPSPTPTLPNRMTFAWTMWLLDASGSDAGSLTMPLIHVMNTSAYAKGIAIQHVEMDSPSLAAYWTTQSRGQDTGMNVRLGSRLLDRKALTKDVGYVKRKLQEALPGGGGPGGGGGGALLGHVVAGKGVAMANPIGGAGSVLPAWRKAYYHLVIPINFPYRNSTAESLQSNLLTHKYTAALRDWAPDTGCYLNEADVDEPDPRHAFWGGGGSSSSSSSSSNNNNNNYQRLLEVKRKYDPSGVFWCRVCVGAWEGIKGN